MKIIDSILLAAISTYTYADNQDIQLQCRESNESAAKNLELTDHEIKFEISQHTSSCENQFTYSQVEHNKDLFIIKSWPTFNELGDNAKTDIFISSTPDKKAVLIGSIPVSANYIDDYTYQNLSQVGGSIYETIYIIKKNSISIQQPSKELMFSGAQCIYLKKDSSFCKKITGTFESPVCIYNIEDRKILAPSSNCSELHLK